MTILFKYHSEDTGFCRVYYRGVNAGGLYCIQEDGSWGASYLNFYVCTKDGEPCYSIEMPDKEAFDKYIVPSKHP